ncbi:MAG: hypothetical protein DMG95_05860 [Acidobacteria bacterium]|nr:MAG: hypothetical protein DMG95_05860 [Acidobacteriota bacterium]
MNGFSDTIFFRLRISLESQTEKKADHPDLKKIVEEIRRIRQSSSLGGIKIRDLIHEGHRY